MDCDAFYASVEKCDDPSLAHRPVLVGSRHRGVVAAACYVARMHNVRSAMPMFMALKRCPDAVVIKPRMARYQEIGQRIRRMMLELTPLVEPLSIDEAFLDLAQTEALHKKSPAESLIALSRRVEDEIGVTLSIGLAGNKSTAKIASDMDKPRGFHLIGIMEAERKLAPMPASTLYGVGKVLAKKLNAAGISTCGDLAQADMKIIAKMAGEAAPILQKRARGIDTRSVNPSSETKSISAETTLHSDSDDSEILLAWLLQLAEKVSLRAKESGYAGRRISLKMKTADHRIITRSMTLPAPTQMTDQIFRGGRSLLEREVKKGKMWRLIGIGIEVLEPAPKTEVFDLGDPDKERRYSLETAMDSLRAKHGQDAIIRGRTLKLKDGKLKNED